MTIEINQPVPDFSLQSTNGQTVNINDYLGKKVVLYFYPKDDTPGCTQESIDFRNLQPQFDILNTVILGISRDNLKSHDKFKQKYELACDLLSDVDETVCHLFNVLKEKNMYGKKVMGIERSTFLLDEKGMIRQIWRKVKVEGHAQEVLQTISNI